MDIQSLSVYDPDGAGPEPEHLIACGSFDNLEGTPARGIAEWDGTSWWAPQANTPTGTYYTAIRHQGELYAGGRFSIGYPAVNLVRWDGAAWQALSADPAQVFNAPVRCMGSFGGSLYAGGEFTNLGADHAAGVARWDGQAWHALGGGLGSTTAPIVVRAILPTPDGVVVAGDFETAGGVPSSAVALWNGTGWSPLAGLGGAGSRVNTLTLHGGEIFAAGLFAGHAPVARWNASASAWAYVSTGSGSSVGEAFALSSSSGSLFASGSITMVDGVPVSFRVARWDGASWSSPPDSGSLSVSRASTVATTVSYRGSLVVGGRDVGYQRYQVTPGELHECLLTCDGGSWSTFAKGVDNVVWDIKRVGGDVVIAGDFLVAGGKRVNGIARWNGTELVPMGVTYVSSLIAGNDGARALHVMPDGTLFAAGLWTNDDHTPDSPVGGVIMWTGTRWKRPSSAIPNNWMFGLATYNGLLVAVGSGRLDTGGVNGAMLLSNSQWLGLGWTGSTLTVARDFGGALFVSVAGAGCYRYNGAFTLVPGATSIKALHVLDDGLYSLGTADVGGASTGVGLYRNGAWVGVGSNLRPVSGASYATGGLARYHNDLMAARAFTLASSPTTRVARFDGAQWRSVTGNPSDVPQPAVGAVQEPAANTVFADGETLWIGGNFRSAGGNASPYLARYVASAGPQISRQPLAAAGCVGRGASFSVASDTATGVEFRWRRNQVPLTEGQTLPGGGTATGTATGELRLMNLGLGDEAEFDCIASTACGSAVSSAVHLSVGVLCCEPDVNADGNVDQEDVAYLVSVVAGGANPSGIDPDFNRDGNVDQGDVAALVDVVAGGGCP